MQHWTKKESLRVNEVVVVVCLLLDKEVECLNAQPILTSMHFFTLFTNEF